MCYIVQLNLADTKFCKWKKWQLMLKYAFLSCIFSKGPSSLLIWDWASRCHHTLLFYIISVILGMLTMPCSIPSSAASLALSSPYYCTNNPAQVFAKERVTPWKSSGVCVKGLPPEYATQHLELTESSWWATHDYKFFFMSHELGRWNIS